MVIRSLFQVRRTLCLAALTLCACGDAAEPGGQATVRPANGTHTSNLSLPPLPLSGLDLFRGIFFGDGPAAAQLPTIWGNITVSPAAADPAHLAQLVREAAARKANLTYQAPGCGLLGLQLCPVTKMSDALNFVANRVSSTDVSASDVQIAFDRFRLDQIAHDQVLTQIGTQNPLYFETFGNAVRSGDAVRVAGALQGGADVLLTSLLPTVEIRGGALVAVPRPFESADVVLDFDIAAEFEFVAAVAVAVAAVAVIEDQYGADTFEQTLVVAQVTRAFAPVEL